MQGLSRIFLYNLIVIASIRGCWSNRFIPFGLMTASRYQTYKYGFPDNTIGSIFPVFDLIRISCADKNKYKMDCMQTYMTNNCIYYHEINKTEKCLFFTDKKWNGYKLKFKTDKKGIIKRKMLNKIKKVMADCSKSENFLLPFLCGWEYFKSLVIESHHEITSLKNPHIMSAMYIYYYCKYSKDSSLSVLCPNPCKSTNILCSSDPNSWENLCAVTNKGVYNDDYSCHCVSGFEWSKANSKCVRQNFCISLDSKIYPCYRRGTKVCLRNIGKSGENLYNCVCHPGFMGIRCDQERNACLQRLDPTELSGYQACQEFIDPENKCIPYKGTDSYQCKCRKNRWKHDSSRANFPNCFRRIESCDGILCQNNGKCVNSEDGISAAVCQCASGWTGPRCQYPNINSWLQWEPWSFCTVTCGQGWRIRKRICRTSIDSDCAGKNIDLRPCGNPCISFSTRYKPIFNFTTLFFFSIGLVLIILLMMNVRIRMEVISQHQSNLDHDQNTRKIARWFQHRNLSIKGKISMQQKKKKQVKFELNQ